MTLLRSDVAMMTMLIWSFITSTIGLSLATYTILQPNITSGFQPDGSTPFTGTIMTQNVIPETTEEYNIDSFANLFTNKVNNIDPNLFVIGNDSLVNGSLVQYQSTHRISNVQGLTVEELKQFASGGPYMSGKGDKMNGPIDMDNHNIDTTHINSLPISQLVGINGSVVTGHAAVFTDDTTIEDSGIALTSLALCNDSSPNIGWVVAFANPRQITSSNIEANKMVTCTTPGSSDDVVVFDGTSRKIKPGSYQSADIADISDYSRVDEKQIFSAPLTAPTTISVKPILLVARATEDVTISDTNIFKLVPLINPVITNPSNTFNVFSNYIQYTGVIPVTLKIQISFSVADTVSNTITYVFVNKGINESKQEFRTINLYKSMGFQPTFVELITAAGTNDIFSFGTHTLAEPIIFKNIVFNVWAL